MQLAIQRTDQFKLFPVIVLLQYNRRQYVSYCAILGCLAQIRTSSVVHAVGHALRGSGRRQAISELVHVGVKHCGMDLNAASRVLRSDSVRSGWMPARCERRASLVNLTNLLIGKQTQNKT